MNPLVNVCYSYADIVRLRDFRGLFWIGCSVSDGFWPEESQMPWSYILLIMRRFVTEARCRCSEAVSHDGSWVLLCERLQQPNSWGRRNLGVRSVNEGDALSLRLVGQKSWFWEEELAKSLRLVLGWANTFRIAFTECQQAVTVIVHNEQLLWTVVLTFNMNNWLLLLIDDA